MHRAGFIVGRAAAMLLSAALVAWVARSGGWPVVAVALVVAGLGSGPRRPRPPSPPINAPGGAA